MTSTVNLSKQIIFVRPNPEIGQKMANDELLFQALLKRFCYTLECTPGHTYNMLQLEM